MGCDTAKAGDLLPVYWFQSTHPHRVRRSNCCFHSFQGGFNPRTRTGCDVKCVRPMVSVLSFNPRTRTGCDSATMTRFSRLSGFNPRTRTGCDVYRPEYYKTEGKFQSTHPHGVRHHPALTAQPRPHVSIHAPARGATHHFLEQRAQTFVSIHAPARGATVYSAMS